MKMAMQSVHHEDITINLTWYFVSKLTVAETKELARKHGCLDDHGFTDEVIVDEGEVSDRYVTIPAGETVAAVEWLIERSHGNKSTLDINNVYLGSSVDEINPYQTGLFTDHTVYDRLTGDNAETYSGCGPHGRVFCPCED